MRIVAFCPYRRSRFLRPEFLLGVLAYLLLSTHQPLSVGWAGENNASVDFKREIRPILSNRCFACHGPDEEKMEGGLRLDLRERAVQKSDSGEIAIVPGHADRSEMIRRILSSDAGDRMPPPEFGAALTPDEIAKLKAWIEQGADYAKHWSFDKVSSEVPKWIHVDHPEFSHWNKNPIDRLLWSALKERNWLPSKRADKGLLLRRATVDLTGLPPTPAELDSFLNDDSHDAFSQRVDAMLASPAFGEHWGRRWLDLARYADSAGYADDPSRTIWGYRDWVIRSINSGMAFDQFTLEQIAGDLLVPHTEEQLVATAFHRNTLTNNEGGTNDEEFRNAAVVDRVNTTMAVWMGVTMACAQCHTHKFDPITQTEYFQLFAIFNQTKDNDQRDESPVHAWFTPDQRQQQQSWKSELEQLKDRLQQPSEELLAAQHLWEAELRPAIPWTPLIPARAHTSQSENASAQSDPIAILDGGTVAYQGTADHETIGVQFRVESPEDLHALRGVSIRTLPTTVDGGLRSGNGDGNFVLTNLRGRLVSESSNSVTARYVRIENPGNDKILSLAECEVFEGSENVARRGTATQSSTGFEGVASRAIDGNTDGDYRQNSVTHTAISKSPWWELDMGQSRNVERMVLWNRTDSSLGNRWMGAVISLLDEARKPVAEFRITRGDKSYEIKTARSFELRWNRARSDYEQSNFPATFAIDADAKSGWAVGGSIDREHQLDISIHPILPADLDGILFPAQLQLSLEFQSPHKKHVLTQFRVATTNDQRLDQVLPIPREILGILGDDPKMRDADKSNQLHRYYVSEIAKERAPWREKIAELERNLKSLQPTTTVPVMQDLEPQNERPTFVQLRGNYRVHGDLVHPGLPTAFHALRSETHASTPKPNRLDLARWLVQEDNPLTARVIANRYWEYLFGTGIVRTSEEFGSQGDLPTHPELLDYLASELVRLNWDTKRFLRALVLSEAYQQTSSVSRDRFEQDPDNVYLSRGPRFRETAEVIRDMSLSASGLMSHRMYGPPVRPPQPNLGLSAAFGGGTDWEASRGGDRYRRALYTQWRRSSPYPSMAMFDAPNREVCVLKRDRTNTPLQALVTLNDPAFMEAAQMLARRIVLYEQADAAFVDRLNHLFRLTLCRAPYDKEVATLQSLFESSVTDIQSMPDQGRELATNPLGPLPENANAIEIAAWTALCNVVLNLDEFLMKP